MWVPGSLWYLVCVCGAGERTRTFTGTPLEPKSSASTNSATPAASHTGEHNSKKNGYALVCNKKRQKPASQLHIPLHTSPAALVCDLAGELTFAEQLALIEELTGSWSLPERNVAEEDDDGLDFIGKASGYYDCEPATSLEEIRKYHSDSKWVAGREAARQAISVATGSSRSPMEAITYCMFALPHSLGGFNCGPLKPNYKIVLTGKASMLSGLPYVIADAYLPRFKAILEYNGSYHDESTIRRRDEARALGLMSMNVDVYRLNDLQLKDAAALESVARTLYRRKQIQFSPRARAYASKCPELLRELRQAVGLGN